MAGNKWRDMRDGTCVARNKWRDMRDGACVARNKWWGKRGAKCLAGQAATGGPVGEGNLTCGATAKGQTALRKLSVRARVAASAARLEVPARPGRTGSYPAMQQRRAALSDHGAG
ncbi:MAG: hypothetical protein JJU07_04730 [Natronohydrobacter sp.]|nr:hypothetical protein [Natronohydrobacter sp.]